MRLRKHARAYRTVHTVTHAGAVALSHVPGYSEQRVWDALCTGRIVYWCRRNRNCAEEKPSPA
eukprot:3576277-Pleurochrysis_carterae.AAC.1